ncbi:HDOD domain-containing protein [Thermanaerothrix sp.]|jgi:putative nucleotidyltransferase with HDIG domain|uniref:HDOD domain-containing protein n=1 Tax=Thermanaerothrix sp. TaxID=2972675 RepID=UPI002ADDC45A|nr:HDOD domain-containing protein [Thermanaerothrix sp.]
MRATRLTQLLQAIDRLHPLPGNVTRILRALEEPDTTASLLAELIGLDQALASQVLHMANAASLGYAPECTTLHAAIMRLGFKRIKTLVMGAAVSNQLNRGLPGYRLGPGQLWNHAVASATLAQWLAHRFNYPNPEEAYIGGLLHDIGKLLLDQYLLLDYQSFLDMVHTKKTLLWQAEETLIGLNHAQVGGMMAEKWSFPSVLVEAIRYHHAPSLSFEHPRLAAIVNLASAIATRDTIGITDPYGDIPHPEALAILHLSTADYERLRDQAYRYLVNQPQSS